jgi:hypothetical protein
MSGESMRAAILVSCLALFLAIGVPPAVGGPDAAAPWRALTRMDVDAAYRLLKDNHPAADPEVGDSTFTAALETAHAKALRRASTVMNIEGYAATLGEFANSMGDGHIWSHLLFTPRSVEWAGIIAAKRGPDWVVANDEPKVVGAELAGARIVGCDGVSSEDLARDGLHYITVVPVQAMQIVHAGALLVDDGNPFLKRPRACAFDVDGKRKTITLHWRKIALTKLHETYWKHPYGQAGFGVRSVDGGYWIAVQSLEPEAQPVIDAAKAQSDRIRAARFVVVDLRGNGGGDDNYGRMLAEALYGPGYVEAVLGQRENSGDCASVFRASSGNIEAIAKLAEQFASSGDQVGARQYANAVVAMKAAAAKHATLTGPPVCAKKRDASTSAGGKSLMKAPVVVLTDALCFSSCIGTVGYFRRLGAIQAGQITGSDTHYSEVREVVLPSGLSVFSTLDAIMPDEPRQLGPHAPDFPYSGDIADTSALETWIPATVLQNPPR